MHFAYWLAFPRKMPTCETGYRFTIMSGNDYPHFANSEQILKEPSTQQGSDAHVSDWHRHMPQNHILHWEKQGADTSGHHVAKY